MTITDVEDIPLYLATRNDIADSTQDALIIKIYTDEDIVDIRETNTLPHVGKAVFAAPISGNKYQRIRENIFRENPLEVKKIWEKMYIRAYV